MKPAIAPAVGEVVETTTRTRRVPAEISTEAKTPELWEYLAEIERKGEWSNHIVYIYRDEPAPSTAVQKCARYVVAPTGEQIPIFNREEVEFAFLKHFGGRLFRFMVKRGSMLVTKGTIFVDAAPRMIQQPSDPAARIASAPGMAPIVTPMSPEASLASHAIDTIAGQEHQAVRIGIDALGAAANIVKTFGNGGSGPQDDLMRLVLTAMVQRMTADPMEQFVRMLTVMREVGGSGGGGNGSANGLTDKLLSAAIDRFLSPPATGTPTNATAELVRMLPAIGGNVVEGLREYRMAIEKHAELAKVQAMAGPRPMPASTMPPAQVIPPQPAAPPNGAPSMDFIEQRIMEIFNRPISAVQAADDALALLDGINPQIVDELARYGETGLLQLFNSRPILKPACANAGRLVEFIREFLKMHAEDQAGEEPGGAAPKVPLPN